MPSANCHCGAVEIRIPRRPRKLTHCNCSICRRHGVLWTCCNDSEVELRAAPDANDDCLWGDRLLKFIRCRHCGCVMRRKSLTIGKDSRTVVNARNFDPAVIGAVKIRLLDGADTWKFVGWERGRS